MGLLHEKILERISENLKNLHNGKISYWQVIGPVVEEMRREYPNFDDAKGNWAFHVGKVEAWFEKWLK